MKKIIYILFASFFLMTSCSLKNEMYDKINPDFFPKTQEDALTLVNSNYAVFGPRAMYSFAVGYVTNSEMVSDYVENSWIWPTTYNMHEAKDWIINGDGRRLFDHYNKLSKMTLDIERISKVTMDENVKARYIAEIKCAKGYLGFILYDLFGPIILPDLETLQHPVESQILPRVGEKEMQDFIETNLLEAAEVLPYKYPTTEYGRFTKGMANTLLLKLYMMVGRWGDAEKIGRELTKSEYGYQLEKDYNKLFTLGGERNPEIIYAVPCKEGIAENDWFAHVLPPDFPTPGMSVTKWGGFKIAWPAYESFDPKDIRRTRMIGEYTGDKGVEHNRFLDRDNGKKGLLYKGAVPQKFAIEGVKGEGCEIDIPVYRYADVLTLLSEAIVRNGNVVTQEAVDLLNQVRVTHGGLQPYQIGDFSGVEDFLDKMLEERGYEFWFEGVRRQDLIRHGKFIEAAVKKAEFAGEPTGKITTKVDGHWKYERFPLPTWIINEGQGVIEQNPGY